MEVDAPQPMQRSSMNQSPSAPSGWRRRGMATRPKLSPDRITVCRPLPSKCRSGALPGDRAERPRITLSSNARRPGLEASDERRSSRLKGACRDVRITRPRTRGPANAEKCRRSQGLGDLHGCRRHGRRGGSATAPWSACRRCRRCAGLAGDAPDTAGDFVDGDPRDGPHHVALDADHGVGQLLDDCFSATSKTPSRSSLGSGAWFLPVGFGWLCGCRPAGDVTRPGSS